MSALRLYRLFFLPVKPGEDVRLFNGLLSNLAARGATDSDFINEHTRDFDKALAAARESETDISTLAHDTGIDALDLERFFSWFATTPRTLTLYSQGVNQSSAGADKVNAILNCHLATGRIGKPGSGPYYDGTIFHRIISGFMIQGGDPLGQGYGGPGFTFDDEIHPDLAFNRKYLLAMANAGSRGGRGTNGSQFFITVSTPEYLNGKHTIFGEVADEQRKKVVDEIAGVRTGSGDRPVQDVVLESVTIERRSA